MALADDIDALVVALNTTELGFAYGVYRATFIFTGGESYELKQVAGVWSIDVYTPPAS